MSWRVAKSLDVLLTQINEIAPKRSKGSDGSIGDADHANRSSDHNPHCGPGVVTARDFTHDPKNGADMNAITEALRKAKDPRIKYVIWNKRMFSSYATSSHPAWTWRPYSGVNLHTAHAHVSVQCNESKDSARPWKLELPKPPALYEVDVAGKKSEFKRLKAAMRRVKSAVERGKRVIVRKR